MSDDVSNNRALLPAGLRDLLPPDAETEAASVEALMEVFAAHGYQRVKPPLLEFEDSLLAGSGAAVAEQTFRLMDPESQRMMGLRADTTPQVARIATTRLAQAPRPLRLSYAGQCLRMRGSQLAPDRQIAQAGIELIGCDNPAADAEIVLVGAEALASVGLTRTSFDLTLPALASARLPPAARDLADRLAAAIAAIRARAPALRLTVDPVEFRGFRYETGVSVTIYAPGRHEELGRGGRYVCGEAEPATGLTLFPDAVLRAAPQREARQRLYVPLGADQDEAARMRHLGYATIAALMAADDPAAEARRLSCSHILRNGSAVPLTGA